MTIRTLCVFCGSSAGHGAEYRAAAEQLGAELAGRNWRLVYGGGQVGLMGILADAVLAGGGEVIGVIPRSLATRELMHTGATQMHVVESMHERKAKMAELADAFAALPGGYGTLEEIMEVITWVQLGIHARPIGLLNVAGFFQPLLNMIDHAVAEGFIRQEQRRLFVVGEEPALFLDALENFQPPQFRKWLDADES